MLHITPLRAPQDWRVRQKSEVITPRKGNWNNPKTTLNNYTITQFTKLFDKLPPTKLKLIEMYSKQLASFGRLVAQ